ncbi:FGGY-family carbohydrate kinase [Lichenihabitans psoromatis]|uniref:FGGY-family carbohydrate kinase n=1 Tax=Lichenihabitans psoromatis TaxID=2528642 RepID=UPI0010355F14|nr:FGGY-family carbohydrate kinase [Lichenihabitans psoromatis]
MTNADRPADTLVLGIDIGTSGVRIVAIDASDRVVASAAVPMAPPDRVGARITQDPEVWWTATETALHQILGTIDIACVRAIAVDGTSGTVLAVDEAGQPIGRASLYNDTCPPEIVARIGGVAPDGNAARGATSALGRALALQDQPGTVRILHQADWIAARLTGRFGTSDENNALKTGYDPVERCWPDWIAATGLRIGLLPKVVAAGTPIGPIAAEAEAAFGLEPTTLVVAGTTDGCAAFLATGATGLGEGVTSLGSTLVLKLLCDAPIFAPAYGIYSHRIGDMWLAGGASNSGGTALLGFFTAERMRALEPELDADTPTGLDYYPLPGPGERFPINDPALPSRCEPRPASDATFFQGLLEGVAAVEALGYRRLAELGGPPLVSIRTVGGGANNAAWSRIRSRLTGVALLPPAHAEAACGAAWLARRGLNTA